jgi:hypothetical protein
MRLAGYVACIGPKRNAYKVLEEKAEGTRLLQRPRRRWEDHIKMDLRETGWGDTEWIYLAQNRDQWRAVVKMVMNLWVP